MHTSTEADMIFRKRLKSALQSKDTPVWSEHDLWASQPNKGGTYVGTLPEHLQRLFVLREELQAERRSEEHRRCVAILRSEDYDHEAVEYMVYCQVGEDPMFNREQVVEHLLNRRVYRHFPSLTTPRGRHLQYTISKGFRVYTNGRILSTIDDLLGSICATIRECVDQET